MPNVVITRSAAVLNTTPGPMKPLDISNEIENIRPAQSAVLTLLMGLGKVTVDSRTFLINQQDIDISYITLTALSGANATCSALDCSFLRPGQTLRLDYTTVTYIKTITNYAAGTFVVDDATSLTSSSVLILGSTASEELSSRPAAISRAPVQVENYCETLRDSYGQSRWVETEKHYGGSRAFHNRDLCLWEHKRFIDRGIWFNKKKSTTNIGTNTAQTYKTNGILASIETNQRTFAGTVAWATMRSFITTDTRFSLSPNLWLAVSRKGLQLIENVIYTKTTPAQFSEAQQIKVLNLGMGNKTLKIFVIDHFEQGMESAMVMLDPEMIEIVTTKDQKTGTRQWMLERKFDGNDTTGTDGTIGEVLTDFGVRLHNERAHAVWRGATA